MTHSENQNPVPVIRAVMPPVVQRSAFAAGVRSDLEKVLEQTTPDARALAISCLTQLYEEEPLQGLADWLKSVPKKKFVKVQHMDCWINLLCSLIERYAAITNRKQTKGISWRADCLKGMLRGLKRTPGKIWDLQDKWKLLTDSLVTEAQPRTKNPITKAYYKKGRRKLGQFAKLGIFIKTGKNVWKGQYDFPLDLLRDIDRERLRELLKKRSFHQKKIALFAMRMDFLKQQQEHSAGVKKQLLAWMALKSLVVRLGDWELAKKADEALIPFQPIEDSLVTELEVAEKANKARQRRPNAKPRKPR